MSRLAIAVIHGIGGLTKAEPEQTAARTFSEPLRYGLIARPGILRPARPGPGTVGPRPQARRQQFIGGMVSQIGSQMTEPLGGVGPGSSSIFRPRGRVVISNLAE
jgi:hypothetical protein